MSQNPGGGVFALSIDTQGQSAKGSQVELSPILQLLQRVQVAATFTTPTPGSDGLLERLRAQPPRHELALLADSSWVGAKVGRTQFARELARRIAVAKGHDVSVRTIAVADAELTSDLDLLVKHRISVVRSPFNTGFEPQSLRFGIWQAPVSFTLPSHGRWQFGGTEWSINRALSRASRTQGLVHLVVEPETLRDHGVVATLERVLTTVQRRRDKGLLAVVTMQGLVARLAPRRQAISARSVLRVA